MLLVSFESLSGTHCIVLNDALTAIDVNKEIILIIYVFTELQCNMKL